MLKIDKSTLQGASKETHPEVFRGIEAVASEFPDGWSVHLIPDISTDILVIRLTADSSHKLPAEKQTTENVQNALRQMRKALEP
jgi:hypothetical protein